MSNVLIIFGLMIGTVIALEWYDHHQMENCMELNNPRLMGTSGNFKTCSSIFSDTADKSRIGKDR